MSVKQTIGLAFTAASLAWAGTASAQVNLDNHVYAHGQGGYAYVDEYGYERDRSGSYSGEAYRSSQRYAGSRDAGSRYSYYRDTGNGLRRGHGAAYPQIVAPPPFDTGPLIRSGLIGIVGAYTGREVVIRVDDEIVYEGTPYGGGNGPWELPYEVDIYPALLAVTVDGCMEPVMMEIRDRDKNPTLVIRGCDIALYND